MPAGHGKTARSWCVLVPVYLPVVVTLLASAARAWTSDSDVARLFTVRDSIEMVVFTNPNTKAGELSVKASPNKRYFVVVTCRGKVASDTTEATIWLFRSDELAAFLSGAKPRPPAPRVVARLAATPKVSYLSSPTPIISDVTWSPDSRSLLFLGENAAGRRQVYRVGVPSGVVLPLTSSASDVDAFRFARGALVYQALPAGARMDAGYSLNADARDVTDAPMASLLFPEAQDFLKYDELWVVQGGRTLRVKDKRTGNRLHLLRHHPMVHSLSPDGRFLVVLLPVEKAPPTWDRYAPVRSFEKPRARNPATTSPFNLWRLTQYALVDLANGDVTSLLDAPNGWALGHASKNGAVWSPSGTKLLLTNTYLPSDGESRSERLQRENSCDAAVVDRGFGEISCVAYSPESSGFASILLSAHFGAKDEEVRLEYAVPPGLRMERGFHYENGFWKLVDEGPSKSIHADEKGTRDCEPVCLTVKEDLSIRPALWASDRMGRSKKIWDPNEHLSSFNLGEASVFHWTDKSGYEWTGGLVKPPDYMQGRRYPLVIQDYMFNEREFLTDGGFTTAFAARPLAGAGLVVLQIRQRHDRKGTADEAPQQIEGFESAIDRLASDGLIDANKVGIIGFSRTAYFVESALVNHPERFAAASVSDGSDESYMQYLLSTGVGLSGDLSESIYGSPPFGAGLKKWIECAPGFQLNRLTTPLRIEALNPDSLLTEWELYASLWRQGRAVDLIYMPEGQHLLQRPLQRIASQQGNVDWFRFWLKGEEDQDPSKARQYIHWRQLRRKKEIAIGQEPTQ